MGLIKQIQTDLEMGAVRLFNEYYARLLADARELYKDNGLAEDAAMATLEQFISCREKYDPAKGELYPWLKTIMRNNFISSKRVRKNTDTLYVSPEELKILSDSQANPLDFDEKISRDEEKIVVDAVKTLSPKLREAVMLHYFDDQPLANIARYLKISESSVKNRLFCARKILAHRLADKLGKKKPLAILLAFLFGAGALFGAWQAGVALVEAMSNGESNNQTTLTTKQEVPKMNTLTKLAAPLVVATLSTTAPAVDVTSLIPSGAEDKTVDTGVHQYSYDDREIVIFADPGEYQVTLPDNVTSIDYLIVGGGGGGGGLVGGGGGAGGFITANSVSTANGATLSVKVGKGGAGGGKNGQWAGNPGIKGEPTVLTIGDQTFTADGGGFGGPAWTKGGDGGSGGGGGGGAGSTAAGGKATNDGVQGFAGATGAASVGGGGGGAGSAGNGSAGGAGRVSLITGKEVTYARGGNGNSEAVDGAEGTGNGGGGAKSSNGGAGGSGIVIIRYSTEIVETFTLKLNTGDHGTATVSPEGPYYKGDIVTLTATPDAGYGFVGWSGSVTGQETTMQITMDEDKEVTATFGCVLTIIPSEYGVFEGATSGEVFEIGKSVNLTAIPNDGCEFVAWGGDASGSTPSTTIKMDGPRTAMAYFKDANGRFHTEWGYSNVVKVAGAKRCVLAFTKVGKQHILPLPSNVREMDYLVVGGGGGGGGCWGGGGGAGGLIASNGVAIAKGATLSVLVGAGGAGGSGSSSAPQNGNNGSASTLSYGGISLVADGGGFGASTWRAGGSGGSGGGCGSQKEGSGGSATQVSKGGMGNNGGDGLDKAFLVGAGGGGASGRGGDNSSSVPGAGGLGFESSITGEPVCYAAGGAGGKGSDAPSNSADGTGSGGDGSGNGKTGGKGGDGIVIVSYPIAASGLMLMIF